jgi:alpha-L-fucosidase
MFTRFGPYSLASVEASWPIMTPNPGGISEEEYVRFAQTFNPERFDARAIRLAGQNT